MTLTFEQIESALYDAGLDGWGLELTVADECCWSAELRITPKSSGVGCDVSTVFFSVGNANPLEGAQKVFDAFEKWKRTHDLVE
jgi:hypothetical protein